MTARPKPDARERLLDVQQLYRDFQRGESMATLVRRQQARLRAHERALLLRAADAAEWTARNVRYSRGGKAWTPSIVALRAAIMASAKRGARP